MKPGWRRLTLALLLGATRDAAADEAVLRNGDRIRGEVTALAVARMIMLAAYALLLSRLLPL